MSEELRECPFCGGKAEMMWVDDNPCDDATKPNAAHVGCVDCDITTDVTIQSWI
jgi:hypothetical protein